MLVMTFNDVVRVLKECIVSVLVFSYRKLIFIILCSYCKHFSFTSSERKLNMFRLESYFTRSYNTYVTGSEKRYIVAHKMIFLYKRCYSKTRNIFYTLKKNFFWA